MIDDKPKTEEEAAQKPAHERPSYQLMADGSPEARWELALRDRWFDTFNAYVTGVLSSDHDLSHDVVLQWAGGFADRVHGSIHGYSKRCVGEPQPESADVSTDETRKVPP